MGLLTFDDFAFSGLGQRRGLLERAGFPGAARWLRRGGRAAPRERPGEARARRTRTRVRGEISSSKLRELDARARDCAKRLAAANRRLRKCNQRCRAIAGGQPIRRRTVADAETGPPIPAAFRGKSRRQIQEMVRRARAKPKIRQVSYLAPGVRRAAAFQSIVSQMTPYTAWAG